MSDAELVERAQRGDQSAFEEIYDRHAPGITRVLASFAGPDRDALDDLIQDVFCRVIEGIESYAPRRPFSHWLYTIALNAGRNHVRGRAKLVVLDPAELEGIEAERDGLSASWVEKPEIVLMRLVARLPESLREVVSLRIGSEMSYREIGEMLGVPEGTARRRMHDAVILLRKQSFGAGAGKESK